MDRDELIALVKRIRTSGEINAEVHAMIDMFLQNVPDPHAFRYLIAEEYDHATPQEIVDKALSYKPICL